jgi:hypothetical protein
MGNTDSSPSTSLFAGSSTSAGSLHHRRHSSLFHIERVASLDQNDSDILETRLKPIVSPARPRRQSKRYSGKRQWNGLLGRKVAAEGIELTETELL